MNVTELAKVLGRLEANWPDKLGDGALDMWREELTPLEFSPAWGAARELTHEAKYFPRLAEFLTAYSHHRRRQEPHRDHPGCERCDDSGWFTTDRSANEVIPCSTCRTEAFELWARGEIPKTDHPPTLNRFGFRTEHDRPDQDTGAADRIRAIRDALPTRGSSARRQLAGEPDPPTEDTDE